MLKEKCFKLICFDVDGVLTDGMVHIDEDGKEYKSFYLTEIDAINDIKDMGFKIAAITGENTPIVDNFKRRIKWDAFVSGCKDKLSSIHALENKFNISNDEICYIGDGKYDIPVIRYVGLGVCPLNAIKEVKAVADVILDGSGGRSCIYELYLLLKTIKERQAKMADNLEFHAMLQSGLDNHISMCQRIYSGEEVNSCIQQAALIVLRSLKSGGALYLCGNGGSAADSQHIAAEFVSRFYKERCALNAEALTVNTSSLTAIGNDYFFDQVFVRQIEAKGKVGDVLIGITTSGSSKNVINAMNYASNNGIHTILLTSDNYKNGDVNTYECVIRIPSVDTPRIQEGHIFVGHIIAEYVESKIGELINGKTH